MQPNSFIIADINSVYTHGLASLFTTAFTNVTVTEAADYAELFTMASENWFDLAIINADLPPQGGFNAVEHLREHHRHCRIIVYAHDNNARLMVKAFAAGASAFFFSNEKRDAILHTITEVLTKGFCVTANAFAAYASAQKRLLPMHDDKKLTLREKEVLQLILAGCTSKEAAAQLYVAEKTVVNHRNNINAKTKCHNVAQLLKYAQENGLI